jgi:hypothetical protein
LLPDNENIHLREETCLPKSLLSTMN